LSTYAKNTLRNRQYFGPATSGMEELRCVGLGEGLTVSRLLQHR
jgi:hypothetical protein